MCDLPELQRTYRRRLTLFTTLAWLLSCPGPALASGVQAADEVSAQVGWAEGWLSLLSEEPARARAEPRLISELDELVSRGEFESLVAGAELLWDRAPQPWAQAEIGRRLARARRFDEAAVSLRRAASETTDANVLLLLAATEWELGEVDTASGRFEAAAEAARARHDAAAVYRALRQLGALHLWAGDFSAAVGALERAAQLPASAEDALLELDRARAWSGLARAPAEALAEAGAATARQALERARDLFRAALRRMPQNSEVRYGLARVLGELGEKEEAARELAAYQRLYAEDQTRIRSQGRLEAQLAAARERRAAGELTAAMELLEQLPARIEVLELLIDVQLELGRTSEAIAALQRAVALAPDRTDLMVRLNALLLEP